VDIQLAEHLTTADWLPVAQGSHEPADAAALAPLLGAVDAAQLEPERVIVRLGAEQVEELAARSMDERRAIFARSSNVASRTGEVKRTGTVRLDEAAYAGLDLASASMATASNGTHMPAELPLDGDFWRVVGLYLAEGCTTRDGDRIRLSWSFHPTGEEHLVDEVRAFWLRHGVRADARTTDTARVVSVSSRLLGSWWTRVLGLGRTSYVQRLPDLIWDRPDEDKWALLSGLFEGDGSWSLVNGGPSVIIELGTISDELADGVLRLLGDVGIVAARRIGRTARSTKDTHWIRVSGAAQVERALQLVPARDRPGVLASIARQAKRIAPTGYRRFEDGPAWSRVTRVGKEPFAGDVFSMEVVGAHTFVSTGGLTVHNCFPKDVSALKQLAGNSGYHFQLLNAVIEVNELQKRRVVAKLQKHLGSLVGRRIALLGLAFKPDTDDMREASSLVLSARLQADGAQVVAYDPIAEEEARRLIPGIEFAAGALEAAADADAVVLVTEWAEFKELDWTDIAAAMRGTLVVDGRNALDPAAIGAAGLSYEGVGRGTVASLALP
jgi:UDPglucose 6-dehydrogenase